MPIDKTEFGIVMDVSLGQPKNAAILIFVTELGMMVFLQPVISLFVAVSMIALQLSLESYLLLFGATARLASFEQLSYLQPIITQYFIDNKSEIWLLFLIAHSKR